MNVLSYPSLTPSLQLQYLKCSFSYEAIFTIEAVRKRDTVRWLASLEVCTRPFPSAWGASVTLFLNCQISISEAHQFQIMIIKHLKFHQAIAYLHVIRLQSHRYLWQSSGQPIQQMAYNLTGWGMTAYCTQLSALYNYSNNILVRLHESICTCLLKNVLPLLVFYCWEWMLYVLCKCKKYRRGSAN